MKVMYCCVCFKQKTAYEMRISDWSSDVCSSDLLWAGWPFFVRCIASIRNRAPNMWTLIGIGVSAAFAYSVVATLSPELSPASFREHGRVGVYFAAAAVLVSLTSLGPVQELLERSTASPAIQALLALAPQTP